MIMISLLMLSNLTISSSANEQASAVQNDQARTDVAKTKEGSVSGSLADALNNKGLAFADQGKYDEATKVYDQAIRLGPNYAKALKNRGGKFSKPSEGSAIAIR